MRSGNAAACLVAAIAFLLALPAQAALQASLDRYTIAMGDTVRLSLRSDDGSDPADADLSALQEHFEILQRSSNVSTSIINGERSQTRELTLELTPLREGSVLIPPFEVDGSRSEAISVTVQPEPRGPGSDEVVIFEASVDRDSVYVQGQLLLTLRVQQAVNLDSRSITELDIENAYVETLGQNSFQRTIDGRPWLVHEIRYAIFPESSGELVIPTQVFSGRVASGRRTLFDTRPSGRLIRRRSEELRIQVLPRPAAFPDSTWLPSAGLKIEEQWSTSPEELRVGDSTTRTITITADGLQGAQLPPIEGSSASGLRSYPDQPVINNVSGDQGITGIRVDSLALVAVNNGDYELPAIEIPWWDTVSDSLQIARLPARTLKVSGGAARPQAPAADSDPATQTGTASEATLSGSGTSPGPWPWIAAVCASGWAITLLLMLRRRDARAPTRSTEARPSPSLGKVTDACKRNDARQARRALRAWLSAQGHRGPISDWLQQQGQPALSDAVEELERCLYRGGESDWRGAALADALRKLKDPRPQKRSTDPLPALYLSQ